MKYFLVPALLVTFGVVSPASTILIVDNGSSVYFQENPQDPGFAVRSLGQTFVVPSPDTENLLTGFSLSLTPSTSSDVDYRVYLFQWDPVNLMASGAALFTSLAMNASQVPSFTGLNIALNPLFTYIALATTEGVVNDGYADGFLFHNSGDEYGEGAAYQQNSPASNGANGNGSWALELWTPVGGDFAFSATFEAPLAVPEPASALLAIFGGLVIVALALSARIRSVSIGLLAPGA